MNTKTFANSLHRTVGVALATAFLAGVSNADLIDYSNGFPNASGITATHGSNGNIQWQPVQNGVLVITDEQRAPGNGSPMERSANFASTPVNVQKFTNAFTFRMTSTTMSTLADGFTFTFQNAGPNALGGPGGGLGYGPDPSVGTGPNIGHSVAIKFDVWRNGIDPSRSCTGIYANGAIPVGGKDLNPLGINLLSGHTFRADMAYTNPTLTVQLTDLVTSATNTQTYTVDIPTVVGGPTAYVGFTGGTGSCTALQVVSAWRYQSIPLVPTVKSFTVSPVAVPGGKTTTGTITLLEAMPQATVYSLTSLNSAAAAPSTVTVPAGATSASFSVNTAVVTTNVTGSIVASRGSTSSRAPVTVAPVGIDVVTVSVDYLPEGQGATGTITLQAPAAPGAVTVNLVSAVPGVASVPAAVTIPAGQTTAQFAIGTSHVDVNTPCLITATANSTRRTTTLTVRPLRVNVVTLGGVATAKSGWSGTGTLSLEAPAPAGGVTMNLSSNYAAVEVPATVFFAAGSTSATFPVKAGTVGAKTLVTVAASSRVNNVYAKVTVEP
ncbi:MAG: hypothetical protein NT029_09050 [Armatimonadetes bacterium]|nr:hypothetical protein [Armatimonadota bacterium]